MASANDINRMKRAIALAKLGRTSPNPHVGALVVSPSGEVFTGFHTRAGAPHAEIEALGKASDNARGGTLFCTLEPCNHVGRTPPCTHAIIGAGIKRVVFGTRDPAEHGSEAGEGVLRAAGIEVEMGVCEKEAQELVEDFATFVRHGRPWVTWKVASTWDGAMAVQGEKKTRDRETEEWISSAKSRRMVHQMRTDADAVVVGIGTVLADDPSLTVRLVEGPTPLRIVCDSSLRVPLSAHVVASAREFPTLIAHRSVDDEKIEALQRAGATTLFVPEAEPDKAIKWLMTTLAERQIVRVLLESGPGLAKSFFGSETLDEIAAFVAPTVLGDRTALSLFDWATKASSLSTAQRFDFRHAELLDGGDVLLLARVSAPIF